MVKRELTEKWIRGMIDGEFVIDSRHVLLVWEISSYPQYYIPKDDVKEGLLTRADGDPKDIVPRVESQSVRSELGTGTVYRVGSGDGLAVVWNDHDELSSYVRFQWDALNNWFEEDEEVYVHPRDPYSRIDIIPSSRHVVVERNGTVLAETHRPTLLFETGIPVRTYIPKTDVRMDLLTPTESVTGCPYKGFANYWSATIDGNIQRDLVWSYPSPLPAAAGIAGLMSFYDHRVDLTFDRSRGQRQQ